ncbi:phytanoyl-CoA dioxygenase family protein [Flavobacterium sp. LS1R47]|uniref:Phytanoyl-CoA dioxygenase family protein n=1 Tax=Flavobacterium frigoritolerans TaxID=2987686 RepID=A0A9X3C0G7_9FLAO|nr:phytanoyl-CoA dioxygenase family protein [Flavobacterium frigoritolerans]MCV9930776.1 phytanoyl-CoA dioxygenase family protein [Flavobacterium frigoritolerans]
MPWNILENLWNRTLNPNKIANTNENLTWDKEIEILYRLGISMEDALQYLYFEKPDFEAFKIWVNKNKKDIPLGTEELTENVLSSDDLEFWNTNGYVIVKNAIPKEDCKDTQRAIWDFLEMDLDKKESWYKNHQEQKGLMVNFSDHETLNRNRFSPRIKKAYEQLYNTTEIYKTIDKVSFNPPENHEFTFLGGALHWDVSLSQPISFGLQGLLYLTDCGAQDGAFHCVPGFHKKIDSWLNSLKSDINPREEIIKITQPVPIVANAGDFIIWQNTLPHCASANQGTTPRMVQYLTYFPNDYTSSEKWI